MYEYMIINGISTYIIINYDSSFRSLNNPNNKSTVDKLHNNLHNNKLHNNKTNCNCEPIYQLDMRNDIIRSDIFDNSTFSQNLSAGIWVQIPCKCNNNLNNQR